MRTEEELQGCLQRLEGRREVFMPIKILYYITKGSEVWQQEGSGRRLVARCASKAVAGRIARLLNDELERGGIR